MTKYIGNEDRVLKLIKDKEKEIPEKLKPVLEELIAFGLVEKSENLTYILTDRGEYASRWGVKCFLDYEKVQEKKLKGKQNYFPKKPITIYLLSGIILLLLILTIAYFFLLSN